MDRKPATREEIAVLARIAGLELSEAHFEELVEAYGNVEPMLWRLKSGRDRADEPAHVFDPRKFMPTQTDG
jgi:Asp-tRNA(Asn)/Glu-tRNA(Gln) amidotransferase C subunit